MKIAVLLSGEYRVFDICRPTMTFLDDPEVDVYISTWDTTHHNRPGINLSKYETVSEKQISDILGRPSKIQVESVSIQKTLPKQYNCMMIHRWKRGFQMIKDSNIEYDYVIITRFDLFYNPICSIDIKKNLQPYKDSLGSSWTHDGRLGDIFMISSYDKMSEFIDKLTLEKWIAGPEKDWHVWFYEFTSSVFSEIINYTDIHHTICRSISKLGDSFDQVLQHHLDWRDIQLAEFLVQDPDGHKNIWSPEIRKTALDKWQSGYFDRYKSP